MVSVSTFGASESFKLQADYLIRQIGISDL